MANIVLRKTTNFNLVWSDEVVRKVIFITTYIGASAAIRSRSLIRIDAVPQTDPRSEEAVDVFQPPGGAGFLRSDHQAGAPDDPLDLSGPDRPDGDSADPRVVSFTPCCRLMGVMMFLRTLIVMVEDWRRVPDRIRHDLPG